MRRCVAIVYVIYGGLTGYASGRAGADDE